MRLVLSAWCCGGLDVKASLFWKLIIPVAAAFLLSLLFLAFWVPGQIEQNAKQNAIAAAEQTVKQFKILRSYYTANVVKKVLAKGGLSASFEHRHDPEKIPLPATMIHDLSELLAQDGMSVRLYSAFPFPNRSQRVLDDFQKQAWAEISKSPKQVVQDQQVLDGVATVRVAIADTMVNEVCVNCHNAHPDTPKNDWRLGDVRGILEVDVPIAKALANGSQLSHTITLVLALVLVIVIAIVWFIYRNTVGSKLHGLMLALDDIAQGKGDLTQRLDESSGDEIGQVAQSFNGIMVNLQQLVQDIVGVAGRLAHASEQLAAVAKDSKNGVNRQTLRTEQMASAISELSSSFTEVSHNTTRASEQAELARTRAEQGDAKMAQGTDGVRKLAEDVQSAASSIGQLEKKSDDIEGMVGVIRGIAEQTNLLALNAAIEAARAGEQGRGFAVVADEVRTLASKTQTSTEEINHMIEALQSEVKAAVHAMARGRESTQKCESQLLEASGVLRQIDDSVSIMADLNQQIAVAMDEQVSVTSELNQNAEQVHDESQGAVAHAEQILETSLRLESVAVELKGLIGRFKI